MGIQSIPAPATASPPFLGAGSVVVNDVNSAGYFTTTLTAGNYLITVNAGGNSPTQTQSDSLEGMYGWSYHSYESSVRGHTIPYGKSAVVTITTTSTIWLGVSWESPHFIHNYGFYNDNSGNRVTCNVNYADPTKPVIANAYSSNIRVRAIPEASKGKNLMPWNDENTTNRASASPSVGIGSNQNQFQFGYLQGRYYVQPEGGTGGSGVIYSSTDTVTWASTTVTGLSGSIQDYAFGSHNSYRMCVADGGGTGNGIASSTDGVSWTTRSIPVASTLYACTAGNGIFVAVGGVTSGAGPGIFTSTDSITWSQRTSPLSNAQGATFATVAYANGLYLAIADAYDVNVGGSAALSTNGTTWTVCSPRFAAAAEGTQTAGGHNWTANFTIVKNAGISLSPQSKLQSALNRFWLNRNNGQMYTSTNGSKWDVWDTGRGPGYNLGGWAWYHPTNGWEYQSRQNNYASTHHMPTAQFTIYNHTTA
jgi:hypothetical protein